MSLFDHGPGHLRVGRLLLLWPVRQGREAPLIDGVTSVLTREDVWVTEQIPHGGVAIRPWWSPNALGVTWRGVGMHNPARWLRWRFVKARVRWILAGRPPARPMVASAHDGVSIEP